MLICFPAFSSVLCQHTLSFDLFLFLLRFIWEGREGQHNIQNSFFTIALTTLLTNKSFSCDTSPSEILALPGISSGICSAIFSGICSGILSGRWGPAVHTELGRSQVEVQQCTLSWEGPRLRSSSAHWAWKLAKSLAKSWQGGSRGGSWCRHGRGETGGGGGGGGRSGGGGGGGEGGEELAEEEENSSDKI